MDVRTLMKSRVCHALCVVLCLTLAGLALRADFIEFRENKLQAKSAAKATIQLAVSVIWEGGSLEEHNLKALAAFRAKHPTLTLRHFVSPAYFLRGQNNKQIKRTIDAHITSGEEVGLALQAWKSLVQSAGVTFRSTPTFWGQPVTAKVCKIDCGKDVPTSAYETEDLNRIFAASVETLTKVGFAKPNSLFVSGWMASKPVLFAAARHGMTHDFSAVPQSVVKSMLQAFPLYEWVAQTWQTVQPAFKPFTLEAEGRTITEYGNSAATVDFVDAQELMALFQSLLREAASNPTTDYVFHVGVHQETALEFLPRLDYALPRLFDLAAEQEIEIKILSLATDKSQDTQSTSALSH